MVVTDSEMISRSEVEPEQQQQSKNLAFSSMGRQSSIYSLTLDEFQNTLSEIGKNFGSMNMDEFLNSIWTAEENQAQATSTMESAAASKTTNPTQLSQGEVNSSSTDQKGFITNQPSLPRQGSFTLPGTLSRKTVEEVWAKIHKTQPEPPQNPTADPQQRQITLGEMTLEDFLVRAGVVQGQILPPPLSQQQQPYSGFGGTMGNGGSGGGYGQMSSDGQCVNQLDGADQCWMGGNGGGGGRERIIDVPVEKVFERRHRRMIKNRESAARSRARKQAYTLELEAELNQLKEENAQMKQDLAELERNRRQQLLEEQKNKAPSRAQRANGKLTAIRRTSSSSY